MKKLLLLACITLLSCSAVKETESALNTGNYDQAIDIALDNLRTHKNKKSKQPYILLLENAYQKANTRDLERISFLTQNNNDAQLEEVYNIYQLLKERQNKIKPILPLRILEENRNAQFNFTNYSEKIINIKNKLSAYLYSNANKQLTAAKNKEQYRQAYGDFNYLEKINPNYKNTRQLIEKAHQLGIDYIIVDMKNDTRKVIPKRLEDDLLNFSTYDVNDLWTVYHNKKIKKLKYDYAMTIKLRDILISPEQIKERQIIKEKQIPDGKTTLLDANGNVVKDSLGNAIKIDKFKKVVCEVNEFTQFKSVKVKGQVFFKNLKTRQLVDTFPLDSEFIFEHQYATYNGDKTALDSDWLDLVKLRSVPFPSNEQMIFDSGEDLKLKLKDIITHQDF